MTAGQRQETTGVSACSHRSYGVLLDLDHRYSVTVIVEVMFGWNSQK
jgi:hypothetical protein